MEELAQDIISGTLPAGTVLPPEPALCEQFRFSRTVIREGLKLLEERGLVRVEQGRGTSVQPRDSWDLLDPVVLRIALAYDHEMVLLDDLIAVRRLLECEMARAAATQLTEDELAALAENVEQMASSIGDYEQFRSFDLAFHAAVMKGSGSEIGRTIVRTIHTARRAGPAPHRTRCTRVARAHGRGSSGDSRGAGGPRRRACGRPHGSSHRHGLGRAPQQPLLVRSSPETVARSAGTTLAK